MKRIEKFMLPEHTNNLYKNEAISSISLTKEVGDKINELVDALNTLSQEDLAWKQEQEGTIRKGVLYMKDNLLNSLNDLMVLLRDSGFIDDRIEYHCNYLKERLDNLLGSIKEGSTTLDGELIDIRSSYDGKVYTTAGESIRKQIKELFDVIGYVSNVEFVTHPNPKVITTKFLRFLPSSEVKLLDGNYSFEIDGYDNEYNHIFTSYPFNESKLMSEAILSDRVKYIKVKLFRNDGENITIFESSMIKTFLLYEESSHLDKSLNIEGVSPDSKSVGEAIKIERDTLLMHTVKERIEWVKVLDYRYQTNYLLFNPLSFITLTSDLYKYGVRGYDSELNLIFDSGWIETIGNVELSNVVKSERVRYIQVVLQTVDASPITDYASITLHNIYEPLVLPTIPDTSTQMFNHLALNENIKVINHRGFNFEAPENTMPAFKLSVEKGYRYIETDVQFTKDNIPVLIHDETIDRTSNGTGNVNDFTYSQLQALDFGSWFNSKFKNTRIPTFTEFLKFCKYTGVHPYIELKYSGMTEDNIIKLLDIIKHYGMLKKVTIISSEIAFLQIVKNNCDFIRIGLSTQTITDEVISNANSLKTELNEVFITVYTYSYNSDDVDKCVSNDIPLEMWVVNGPSAISLIDPYITGITTDNYDVYQALIDDIE